MAKFISLVWKNAVRNRRRSLLTIASIAATNWMLRVVPVQWLFVPVALGPLLGLLAFRRMVAAELAPRAAGAPSA